MLPILFSESCLLGAGEWKGGDMWFVKLLGPAKTVSDQRANFDAFLQSLQFGEAGE